MNSEATDAPAPRTGAKLLVVLLALIAIVIGFQFLPVAKWVELYRAFILDLGWKGKVVYVAMYALAAVFLLPCPPLTFLAASAFGLIEGYLLALAGGNLGALCAFLLGRGIMRKRIETWANAHPRFSRFDDAVSQRGFYVVLLLRLTPVLPYVLVNYFMGLTRVSLLQFMLGTLLGMLPLTFAVAYLGSLSTDLAGGEQDRVKLVLYVVGFVATISVVTIMTRLARKALHDVEAEANSNTAVAQRN